MSQNIFFTPILYHLPTSNFYIFTNAKEAISLSMAAEYLYFFSEFVEHDLRLQTQKERKLSVKCMNILTNTLNVNSLFSKI